MQGQRQTTKDTPPAIAETRMGNRDCVFRMQRMDGGRESMKLYWRYKKNGAWTWKAALILEVFEYKHFGGRLTKRCVVSSEEEE